MSRDIGAGATPRLAAVFSALPKPERTKSPQAIQFAFRRDGTCMIGLEFKGRTYGPCTDGADVHHIVTRGAGGEDVKENLIRLCRGHHDLAKTGKILPEVFRRILSKRYGYHYDRDHR